MNSAAGPDAERTPDEYLHHYYGGSAFVDTLVQQTPTTQAGLRAVLDAHRDAGCDEILLLPCSADLAQLDPIAELL